MFWWNKNKLKQTYSYDDVTLIPQYSSLLSRSDTNPSMFKYKLPIICSCMDTLGPDMANLFIQKNIPFIAHRSFKSAEEQFKTFTENLKFKQYINDCLWFAVGSVQKYKDWIDYLYNKGIRRFCVDMAHGDSKACIDTIKYIKDIDKFNQNNNNFSVHVIAGNVATVEGFKRLQKAGADGIRVGIASGSICSTALQTAMGVPILTNIMECAKIKKNTWLIADGRN